MMRGNDLPLVLTLVALSAWLGAAVLVAAVVAPAAFAVLPSRMLAGALVGRVLPALFWSGTAVGGAVVVRTVLASGAGSWLAAAGGVLALACATAQLVITPRIEWIRASISVPVDMLESSDPRRIAFGKLHGLSLLSLGVAMLAAAVAGWLCVRMLSRTVGP